MITPSHPSSRDEPIVRNSCRQEVIERTTGEIRTFLSALSNGTSHYKSLHNLTEQIEHQRRTVRTSVAGGIHRGKEREYCQ